MIKNLISCNVCPPSLLSSVVNRLMCSYRVDYSWYIECNKIEQSTTRFKNERWERVFSFNTHHCDFWDYQLSGLSHFYITCCLSNWLNRPFFLFVPVWYICLLLHVHCVYVWQINLIGLVVLCCIFPFGFIYKLKGQPYVVSVLSVFLVNWSRILEHASFWWFLSYFSCVISKVKTNPSKTYLDLIHQCVCL